MKNGHRLTQIEESSSETGSLNEKLYMIKKIMLEKLQGGMAEILSRTPK